MFQILKTGEEEFVILAGKQSKYVSSLPKLVMFLTELGMPLDEIEYGLVELIRHDHDTIEVGLHKTVIFTKKGKAA